jgi:hypothetical protein
MRDKKKLHPAVAKALARIHGVEWHYQLFDYATQFGVCGETYDGRRQAVRFAVKHCSNTKDALTKYAALVEQAKEIVVESLARGEGVRGDDVMEGNEIPMEITK